MGQKGELEAKLKESAEIVKGLESEALEERRKGKVFFQENINLQDKLARINGKGGGKNEKAPESETKEDNKKEAAPDVSIGEELANKLLKIEEEHSKL